jgi:hypothetical protein
MTKFTRNVHHYEYNTLIKKIDRSISLFGCNFNKGPLMDIKLGSGAQTVPVPVTKFTGNVHNYEYIT